jgi:serine/threonine-protein kinase
MEAGQTIAGKYRLNRPLGAGGMASVWSATNVYTDREFAIKVMLPEVASTPEAAGRFLREARVSGRLNHPNIIEVIDVGQAQDGALFLVMELLSGESLDAAVRRRDPSMSMVEFLTLMRDVAKALAAAHEAGVIHRDLKPTNIFLHIGRDGVTVPKLLDFGVSKVLDGRSEGLTAVGTIVGSPLYMSPEQAMGAGTIDGRTDVFAFGAILFEALCGRRAYKASNLHSLIVAIATMEPRSIDEFAPDLPQDLRALVRGCMVKDKTRRLASFDVVVERLDAIIVELAGTDRRLPDPFDGVVESVRSRADGPAPRRPADRSPTTASPRDFGGTSRAPTTASPRDFGGTSPPIAIPMSAPVVLAGRNRPSAPFGSRALGRARSLVPFATGAVVLLAAVVGIAGLMRRGNTTLARSGTTFGAGAATVVVAPAQTPGPLPSSNPSRDVVPTVSVDALPEAKHTVVARARIDGRLTIGAAPGSCSVSIDGVPRGATPLRAFEVAAGLHQVDCVPPSGEPKTATVAVSPGIESRYHFAVPQ